MQRKWKQVLILLMVVVVLFAATACGKSSFHCQFCDKTYEGKGHPETLLGHPITLCDTCYARVKK